MLLAGWGLLTLTVLLIKNVITNMRTSSLGTQLMTGGFLLILLLAGLYVGYMSLKAVFASIGVAEGDEHFMSATGRVFYVCLALGPPAAMAVALGLILSPLRLDFDIGASQQRWLLTSVVGFFSVSVVFLIFQNPSLDIQNLFIGRVQFIQSHAFYALWLGYGILLTIAWIERWWGAGAMKAAAVAGLLPGVLLWQNAYDEEQIKIVGGAEQNGHSWLAIWQLGARRHPWQNEDFQYWFPRRRISPASGGADQRAGHGRAGLSAADDAHAISTAAQTRAFCAHLYDLFRRCPTRCLFDYANALADNTFMNITRDLYGDTILYPVA